jgi:ketosteroid isomerase-like protein
MKILSLVLIIAALCNTSYANEPKEVLAAFQAALSNGDQAKASELLAPDVTIYESGYVESSRAEYVGHHLPEDIAFAKKSTRKLLQTKESIDANLAVIWQETETHAKIKGKELRILGTETSVLQRTGDSWHIVHIHWSSRKAK